jgi:hypothetical protein
LRSLLKSPISDVAGFIETLDRNVREARWWIRRW